MKNNDNKNNTLLLGRDRDYKMAHLPYRSISLLSLRRKKEVPVPLLKSLDTISTLGAQEESGPKSLTHLPQVP